MKEIKPFLTTALVVVAVLFVVFRLLPASARNLITGS